MELFSVKLTYSYPNEEPGVAQHEATTYAAVYGDYGGVTIGKAVKVAIRGVVGSGIDPEKWKVFVLETKYIGSVHVETPGEFAAADKEMRDA